MINDYFWYPSYKEVLNEIKLDFDKVVRIKKKLMEKGKSEEVAIKKILNVIFKKIDKYQEENWEEVKKILSSYNISEEEFESNRDCYFYMASLGKSAYLENDFSSYLDDFIRDLKNS